MDLVVLVPGQDDYETFDGLLKRRRESLGIREIEYQLLKHPRRDPGCYHEAPAVLQPLLGRAAKALVVFDHEGCGQEVRSVAEITADLKGRLELSGWQGRADVLVIRPELEVWVWSESPHVDEILGWAGRQPGLRDWLVANGMWQAGEPKPADPKAGVERALREVRMHRSSALYRQLAEKVGLASCKDEGFARFRA